MVSYKKKQVFDSQGWGKLYEIVDNIMSEPHQLLYTSDPSNTKLNKLLLHALISMQNYLAVNNLIYRKQSDR